MRIDTAYVAHLARGTAALATDIDGWSDDRIAELSHRPSMRAIKTLVAAFSAAPSPLFESRLHHSERTLGRAPALLSHLERMQLPNGLFDSENLASPPDTCFTVNDAFVVLDVIERQPHPALEAIADRIRALLERTVEALLVGGVHTPNHRWELSAGLVRLHGLTGDRRLLARAEQWLAEGIDIDADGLYSERSPNYAAYVSNPSFLTIGAALDDARYPEAVRRNLVVTLALLEDDLSVETVQSRRQDQRERFDARSFLSQFRRFAVLDGDLRFADVVERIVRLGVTEPELHLAEALAHPLLASPLPTPDEPCALEPGVRVLAGSGLARVRRERMSVSVFGGSDVPRVRRIVSGLANSAVFLRARSGAVVVDAVRLSPQFFGLGTFRSQSLAVTGGDSFALRERWAAGYHQPLAPESRRADGDYALGTEGRFYAAMSFDERATDLLELETAVDVTVGERSVDLDLAFDGVDTAWTLEIVLREGGVLSGADELADGSFHLTEGHAQYRVDGSTLTIGPGNGGGPGRRPAFDPGELIEYVGGDDTVPGLRLFVTGRTSTATRVGLVFS